MSIKRKLFSEAQNVRSKLNNDEFLQKEADALRAGGRRLMHTPPATVKFSDFELRYTNGSRTEYEKGFFQVLARINIFALLALLDGEQKYIAQLENAIWAICNEFTWSLHLPDSLTVGEWRREIDLHAAETAFTLAELSHLLGDRLSPRLLARLQFEVRDRVLEPYLSGRRWNWETQPNNWSAVCAGNVGAALLYLGTEEEIAAALPRLKATLRCYIDSFGEDCACAEGVTYWSYGFESYVFFAELLCQYTDGQENLFQHEKVKKIALFQQKAMLRGGRNITFSDCSCSYRHDSGLSHFLGRKYPEFIVPSDSYALHFRTERCQWSSLIRTFAWRDASRQKAEVTQPCFDYLENAAWYIRRTAHFDFAVKAGNNNESHNHNDIGSFLLNADGECVLTDPGGGEYTMDYFAAGRYQYFATASRGHSVPIINGRGQREGAEFSGRILTAEENLFAAEISRAYEDAALTSLHRQFDFNGEQIVLTDRFEFSETPGSVTERMIAAVEPIEKKDGIHLGSVLLCYDQNAMTCHISRETFRATTLELKMVYILDFSLHSPAKQLSAKFIFLPNT